MGGKKKVQTSDSASSGLEDTFHFSERAQEVKQRKKRPNSSNTRKANRSAINKKKKLAFDIALENKVGFMLLG